MTIMRCVCLSFLMQNLRFNAGTLHVFLVCYATLLLHIKKRLQRKF